MDKRLRHDGVRYAIFYTTKMPPHYVGQPSVAFCIYVFWIQAYSRGLIDRLLGHVPWLPMFAGGPWIVAG